MKVKYFRRIVDERYFDIHERAKNKFQIADCVSYEEVDMRNKNTWICNSCSKVWEWIYKKCQRPRCPMCDSLDVKLKE